MHVRFAANSVTEKPSGTVMAFAASSGFSPANCKCPRRRWFDFWPLGKARLLLVEPEIVEVDVSPMPGVLSTIG